MVIPFVSMRFLLLLSKGKYNFCRALVRFFCSSTPFHDTVNNCFTTALENLRFCSYWSEGIGNFFY